MENQHSYCYCYYYCYFDCLKCSCLNEPLETMKDDSFQLMIRNSSSFITTHNVLTVLQWFYPKVINGIFQSYFFLVHVTILTKISRTLIKLYVDWPKSHYLNFSMEVFIPCFTRLDIFDFEKIIIQDLDFHQSLLNLESNSNPKNLNVFTELSF